MHSLARPTEQISSLCAAMSILSRASDPLHVTCFTPYNVNSPTTLSFTDNFDGMFMIDQQVTCRTCGAVFVFTAGEQEFYASKNLSAPDSMQTMSR